MRKVSHSDAGRLGGAKTAEVHKARKQARKEGYNLSPNRCKFCEKVLDYDRRTNKFCSQSCNAKHNRPTQKSNGRFIRKPCILCGKDTKNPKFCGSSCQHEYQYRFWIKNWLDGKEDGIVAGYQTSDRIKRYLIEARGNCCEECGWSKKNPVTGNVPVQLEHIDGNYANNKIDNLKLLCPNCHSLTTTFGNLNKGNGRPNRKR